MLPLAFKFDDAPVLVIGAGKVGCFKARQLLDAGAQVTIISDAVLATLPEGVARFEQRRYRAGDLEGFWLVVAATGDPAVNDEIVREARERTIWLNVVDDPERSSFYFMALHRQGDVTVAVTTDGAAPALAQAIRTMAAERLPDNLGEVAATLRAERHAMHDDGASTENVDWRPRIRELLGTDDAG